MKKFANIIGIVLSLILPALALLSFAGLYEIFLYNWLWCSLYGCILVFVFLQVKDLQGCGYNFEFACNSTLCIWIFDGWPYWPINSFTTYGHSILFDYSYEILAYKLVEGMN